MAVLLAGVGVFGQIPQLEKQALKCRLFLGTLKWDVKEVMNNDVVVTISKWAMLSVWQGIVVLFVIAWSEISESLGVVFRTLHVISS